MHIWAAEVAPAAADWVTTILQWGPPGVVIILLLSGVLVTKGHHDAVVTDRDQWRQAYEREVEAHDETRTGLVEANRSAAAAVETARTTTGLLSHLGHTPRSGS